MLLPLLGLLAYCATIALGVWAICIISPSDTPEDDAHSVPNGDWPIVPTINEGD